MVQWIPCGAAFIEADVIRWTEPVWKPKAREKSRAVKIGMRQITARVVEVTREGWVRLIVKQCVTTNAPDWWKPIPDLSSAFCGPMKGRGQALPAGPVSFPQRATR